MPPWVERLTRKGDECSAETLVVDTDRGDCEEDKSTKELVEDIDEGGLEDEARMRTTEATGLQMARPRNTYDGCPYSLGQRITTPKRYQQAWDDL